MPSGPKRDGPRREQCPPRPRDPALRCRDAPFPHERPALDTSPLAIYPIVAGLLGGIGLCLLAGGLVALGLMPDVPSHLDIGWRMALCGAGFGLFQSPNNHTILTSGPVNRSGGASGMLGTARLLGQTSGAIVTSLLFSLFPARGWVVMFVAAGLALAGAGISMLRVRAGQQPMSAGPDAPARGRRGAG